ncbi:hypothetical protein CTKZ_26300 [Cellulomonas algicola]|uniref:Uncharacterized protein n=1 Tax=Cellulomonas algicola TaxID=2071633 RepID=A0A401V2C5_9CELL|nr:hypothetical protein CTKZ_26300 [Cellulomonas algicola]
MLPGEGERSTEVVRLGLGGAHPTGGLRRKGCHDRPIGGRAGVLSETPDFIPSVASCDGLRGGAGTLRGALGRRLRPAYCVT